MASSCERPQRRAEAVTDGDHSPSGVLVAVFLCGSPGGGGTNHIRAHGVVRAGPRITRPRRRFHNMTMVPTHCEPPLTTNMHTQPQVPADLLKLIYRLASLDRGHVYHLTLVVPEATTAERFWTVQPAGKVENLR